MLLRVEQLRCEYRVNPIGLDVESPRISWQLETTETDVLQAAYQLQVSVVEGFCEVLWDTKQINTDQSIHVTYEGPPLLPQTRYYFRVRVWDTKGNSSAWSERSYWETGLLDSSRWQAKWITADSQLDTMGLQVSPFLRKSFHIKAPPVRARAYVTSLGLYELHVNGQRIGDWLFTPGWTAYETRLQYQTYDVTTVIREGHNALGVILGHGWYTGQIGWKNERNLYGDQRCLLLELHLDYEDGSREVVCSDESWVWKLGPIRFSELYHGELYDANLQLPWWDTAQYVPLDWSQVAVTDHGTTMLVGQENLPTRAIQEIEPVAVIVTPNGETVLDMGQNLVGWVRFEAEADPGTTITLTHAEVLNQDGNLYVGNLREAEQTDRYICRGDGLEVFQPHFTFHGFRYVRVDGLQAVDKTKFRALVIHTDMEQTGYFETSNSLVNQLFQNILWGQRGNFLDVPTDCPQRNERLGWTGDAQVFIRTAAYNMNVASFFAKWLKDLTANQLSNGSVPHVIPNILTERDNGSSAWADAAVICPWTLYLHYGDKQILQNQYESMKAWVEHMRLRGNNENRFEGGFQYGDWLGLDAKEDSYVGATDVNFISNAFYAYSTKLLAQTAEILGKSNDANDYRKLQQNIVQEFQQEFVTDNGSLAVSTQTAHILALWFDLVDERHKPQIAAVLHGYIRDNDMHLSTGFVGTPYLCLALSEYGYSETAFQLLLQQEYPSWLYPITRGATTIWEHWDGIKPDGTFWSDDMNSFNHYAYGSIGEWLYRVVAGIDTDETQPGFKHSIIRPRPSKELSWIRASVATMYGVVKSEWKWTEPEQRFELFVQVPANTTATVVFPHLTLQDFAADVSPDDFIHLMTALNTGTAGQPSLTIGSGQHRFSYKVIQDEMEATS
ncbi:alpha-L-rhamnosidase [Alicyclobacillus sp. SO9]|uniref:alpha-L-rhamnosidase n=1 Tax=Alicyclobacillus sp. SO9 TaxID=2665646 RepID=UPI001E5A50B4|nr:alpha-L-rhamnosidase [Alicyclobacillus sp. SO9]